MDLRNDRGRGHSGRRVPGRREYSRAVRPSRCELRASSESFRCKTRACVPIVIQGCQRGARSDGHYSRFTYSNVANFRLSFPSLIEMQPDALLDPTLNPATDEASLLFASPGEDRHVDLEIACDRSALTKAFLDGGKVVFCRSRERTFEDEGILRCTAQNRPRYQRVYLACVLGLSSLSDKSSSFGVDNVGRRPPMQCNFTPIHHMLQKNMFSCGYLASVF